MHIVYAYGVHLGSGPIICIHDPCIPLRLSFQSNAKALENIGNDLHMLHVQCLLLWQLGRIQTCRYVSFLQQGWAVDQSSVCW